MQLVYITLLKQMHETFLKQLYYIYISLISICFVNVKYLILLLLYSLKQAQLLTSPACSPFSSYATFAFNVRYAPSCEPWIKFSHYNKKLWRSQRNGITIKPVIWKIIFWVFLINENDGKSDSIGFRIDNAPTVFLGSGPQRRFSCS